MELFERQVAMRIEKAQANAESFRDLVSNYICGTQSDINKAALARMGYARVLDAMRDHIRAASLAIGTALPKVGPPPEDATDNDIRVGAVLALAAALLPTKEKCDE